MPAKLDSTDAIKARTAELFAQYQRSPSVRVRNQIVELNIGLAQRAAHRLSQDGQETLEDLIQVGAIGLCKAVERFDPSKGNAFSSYAMPFIRGEISHWRRDKTRMVKVPRSWHDKFPKLRRMLEAGATIAEMIAATKLDEGELTQAIDAMRRPGTVSLDRPLNSDEDEPYQIPSSIGAVTLWDDEMALALTRRADGLIDATEICQRHNRRFTNYWRRRGRRHYENLLKNNKGRQNDTLYLPGNGRGHHTYVCDEIALDLLRWCDPSVGAAVDALALQRIA
jgi:RNA polymerase sigma factor (sigma-70 family)